MVQYVHACVRERVWATHVILIREATCLKLGEDQLSIDLNFKAACIDKRITVALHSFSSEYTRCTRATANKGG